MNFEKRGFFNPKLTLGSMFGRILDADLLQYE